MRRRYLWLLAVFVPTVLGFAALSYLIFAPSPQSEASTTTPIVRQAPQVEEAISDETVMAPADTDVIEPSTPRNDEVPVTEPESPQQRPAHAESSDIVGPPMLASSTATDSGTDALAPTRTRGSLRLASLSAAGGGGGAPSTNGSSKTSGDTATTPPVDTSNSGGSDSSTSGGSSNTGSSGNSGDADPNGGKGGGTGGDNGAAPNTPNPNPDHDEEDEQDDPPVSDNDPYPTDPFPHDGGHEPVQVPEPASFGLLLLGLAGFAAGRRRKN